MTDGLADILDEAALAKLTTIVDDRFHSERCPSLFAALFDGRTTLFSAGRGEFQIGSSAPDSNTVYRIASCSKSFTAAMLLILRDRGLLNLDVPITQYVPEFVQAPVGDSFSVPTLRMLISMSGGLPTDDPWADRQESISSQTLRDLVSSGVIITSAPGTQFQYSNLGYALLGQVVEAIMGIPLRDAVTREILEPLNLHETGYSQDVVTPEQLAHGYRRRATTWVELPFSGPGAFSSIGGLFSSGRDLARWAQWLASALSDRPDEAGPLSVTSRREMQQIVTAIPFSTGLGALASHGDRRFGYGLGLIVEYDERLGQFVSHSGGYPGFSSHMRWHVPTGLGVVVLENATYSGAWQTATALLENVLGDLDFHVGAVAPSTQTQTMAHLADSLVRHWDDDVAAQILEENVALDVPLAERRAAIEQLIADVGEVAAPSSLAYEDNSSDSPLHAIWTIRASHGSVRCEIRLSPVMPALIQTFNVKRA